MKIIWSPAASRDLRHAYQYIAKDNEHAAARIADVIEHHVRYLSVFPAMGRPGRVEGTRELPIPGTPFIAVYQLAGDAVDIVAVMHGSRAWPEEFEEQ